MPRTRRSVLSYYFQTPDFDPPSQIDSAAFCTGSLDFAHTLFAPMHYASGYAYPLIVWLHGRGDDHRQLRRIMPLVSMRNYVAVAPQGTRLTDADHSEGPCHGWLQAADHLQQAEQRVFDSIELAQRKFHISPRRIFLSGFDCGGTVALRLAMSYPSRFAGVISLCGALPKGHSPLGNLIAARRLGMFLATGRGSSQYPADQVCEDLRLLHTAGVSITLRQYPCGHELQPQMLADLNRWIMEQINPPPTSAVQSDAEWSHEAE